MSSGTSKLKSIDWSEEGENSSTGCLPTKVCVGVEGPDGTTTSMCFSWMPVPPRPENPEEPDDPENPEVPWSPCPENPD